MSLPDKESQVFTHGEKELTSAQHPRGVVTTVAQSPTGNVWLIWEDHLDFQVLISCPLKPTQAQPFLPFEVPDTKLQVSLLMSS